METKFDIGDTFSYRSKFLEKKISGFVKTKLALTQLEAIGIVNVRMVLTEKTKVWRKTWKAL